MKEDVGVEEEVDWRRTGEEAGEEGEFVEEEVETDGC